MYMLLTAPQNSVYTNLAQECVNVGCSVDMYIFNNSFIDLATIGQISKLTGGEIFKYTYFQVSTTSLEITHTRVSLSVRDCILIWSSFCAE